MLTAVNNECPSGWEKEFIFFPGDGQKTPVYAGDHGQGETSQWAQYMGPVSIEFWKPVGVFAQWVHIGLTLRNFSPLGSGDVVTFTWTKD